MGNINTRVVRENYILREPYKTLFSYSDVLSDRQGSSITYLFFIPLNTYKSYFFFLELLF